MCKSETDIAAIKAAKTLVDYCKEHEICKDCIFDGMLCVNGTSANDGISEMGTEKWIVCADMYGRLYMVDAESIKYVKIIPHTED